MTNHKFHLSTVKEAISYIDQYNFHECKFNNPDIYLRKRWGQLDKISQLYNIHITKPSSNANGTRQHECAALVKELNTLLSEIEHQKRIDSKKMIWGFLKWIIPILLSGISIKIYFF